MFSFGQGGTVRFADHYRWILGLTLAVLLVFAPYQYYRYVLEHSKRLRPIEEGKVYRSGCLTANGFREALLRNHIKTVISFWDENPDPELSASRFNPSAIKESDLCRSLGVEYRYIFMELLPGQRAVKESPRAIAEFLKVMDDPDAYPVLIHCKAGLHRTGVMAAIYRMEYDGWSKEDAIRELKSHGFGHFLANTTNDYIVQYVINYQPRVRK
jgi:hypothetical protein